MMVSEGAAISNAAYASSPAKDARESIGKVQIAA
ncbi:hypothetical protein EDE05_109185 [Neorhizobium sp. R1-B]|nr:hypothetical protein EDE05_109185 [Neorhizobium sp. R1-B]